MSKRNEYEAIQEFEGENSTVGLVLRCGCGNKLLIAKDVLHMDLTPFSCCSAKHPRLPASKVPAVKKNVLIAKQVEYIGKWQTIKAWAKELGFSGNSIRAWSDAEGKLCIPERILLTVTHKGETKTLLEWAKIVGIPYRILHARHFALGWTVERTLETPLTKKKGVTKKYTYDPQYSKQYYEKNREGLLKRKLEKRQKDRQALKTS